MRKTPLISAKQFSKRLFRLCLNIVFSNNPYKVSQLKIKNRYQLVWISEYVGRKIALKSWENSESRYFENNLKEGDVCLDVGANVGYYTHLFASKAGPSGNILAIEPLERNIRLIELNSTINGASQFIQTVRAIVSDKVDSQIDFSDTADSAFSFVINDSNQRRGGSNHIRPGAEMKKIKSTTIDFLVESHHLERVDVVKIDVEGFEFRVLNGMKRLLSDPVKKPRLMMIELQSKHLEYYSSTIGEVCDFLNGYGYKPNYIDSKGDLTAYETQHYDQFHNVFFVAV